jgi:hypothetical protein
MGSLLCDVQSRNQHCSTRYETGTSTAVGQLSQKDSPSHWCRRRRPGCQSDRPFARTRSGLRLLERDGRGGAAFGYLPPPISKYDFDIEAFDIVVLQYRSPKTWMSESQALMSKYLRYQSLHFRNRSPISERCVIEVYLLRYACNSILKYTSVNIVRYSLKFYPLTECSICT